MESQGLETTTASVLRDGAQIDIKALGEDLAQWCDWHNISTKRNGIRQRKLEKIR